ncbi:MAG TPA: HAMP domain-containing sensor histidine kinase, partial [Candidatus Thermoplasmatota archaeon]
VPLNTIKYNTQRLQRFTADIRDVIALAAGTFTITKEPVELRDIVEHAVDANQPLAKHYSIQLKSTCEASLPVGGDHARLTQVLHDVLRNSFNFTSGGGLVHVIGGVNEDKARVTIQDNGRGMTPDEIQKLFRPFARAHAANESREQGTGLGLFLAQNILDRHGGRIWAESAGRGKGTSITFELPLHNRPFDIRNAKRPPSGTPILPPAMTSAPGIR